METVCNLSFSGDIVASLASLGIVDSVRKHPDFKTKYKDNPDPDTRDLAFEKILKEIMLQRRKNELELYKLFANAPAFKVSWIESMQRIIEEEDIYIDIFILNTSC
ncbi:hypothetical protein PSI23_13635 [Xenorhabdus sp. XENO-10]|uniref:Uncharacterized protein n=1 Tax=Xenorhabdus yunnanensis TaxID=3025878 RepID=A0ABT5LGR8_9GAMM|nr:hypothetical protein [Xenorhabdus yunnanensis]